MLKLYTLHLPCHDKVSVAVHARVSWLVSDALCLLSLLLEGCDSVPACCDTQGGHHKGRGW